MCISFDVNARNQTEFILHLAISIWQHSRQSSVDKWFAIVNMASQSKINQLLSNCLLLLNENGGKVSYLNFFQQKKEKY